MPGPPSDDLERLLEALHGDPDRQAELRRLLGIAEWSRIEAALDRLAAAQERTETRLEALTSRVEALAAAQERTERSLDSLARQVEALTASLGHMTKRQDEMLGTIYELRYRTHGPAYFGSIARSLVPVGWPELNQLLDAAVGEGALSEEEAQEVRRSDAVLRGRMREDDRDVYLVVEVSVGVGLSDVRRALERSQLLARAGVEAVAVVAGGSVTLAAEEMARDRGVWQVTDGRTAAPGA